MQGINTIIQATANSGQGKGRNATHPNREGAPAYRRSLREQVIQVLSTGTMSDTFYASGHELAKEAVEVLLRAREECPEFLARALVWARNQGFMKTAPVLGLVILSGGRGLTRKLFEAVFDQVVLIPDDLRAFVALCRAGTIPGRNGLGGVARLMARKWICGLSEYHALKYGSAASEGVTLRDILRMTHPCPENVALAERFGWLVKGSLGLGENPMQNPQIRALEALKVAKTEEEAVALVRGGRLPYEVVVPSVAKMTPALWTELLRNAPYMNLLKNLVTFTRHGVFEDEENVRIAVAKLTNPRAVENSKVLPFRYFDAWRMYVKEERSDSRIADALRTALELSFVNMPSFGERMICVATDVSGSMGSFVPKPGKQVDSWNAEDQGRGRYIDIAGIFTGALLRKVENRLIALPFDGSVRHDIARTLSGRDDILATTEKIAQACGGATAVGAPVEHLLRLRTKVDVFVGITDNEEWAYGNGYGCSANFLDLWRRYKKEVAPDAQAFLVTIAPYRDAVAPQHENGVHYIYGWSDQVLRYIGLKLETGESQVQAIAKMELEGLS